jgi:hypothetical protein
MKMKIEFSMDNDSFKQDSQYEMSAILRKIHESAVWEYERKGAVMDSNGNRIGQWIVED